VAGGDVDGTCADPDVRPAHRRLAGRHARQHLKQPGPRLRVHAELLVHHRPQHAVDTPRPVQRGTLVEGLIDVGGEVRRGPIKLLDGIWFGVNGQWVGPATKFTSGFGYVRMALPATGGVQLTRTDFAPDGPRAVEIGLTPTASAQPAPWSGAERATASSATRCRGSSTLCDAVGEPVRAPAPRCHTGGRPA
jgi:hypothetical protein